MKKINLSSKILFSILFVICLFLFKNINKVEAATTPYYRWPVGGDNANETYIDYEYYGTAGQAPVKNGKSGREYIVNNKLWPNEKAYYAACESHYGMDITGINGHTYKVVSVVEGTVIATNAGYAYAPNKIYADSNQRRPNNCLYEGGGYGNYIVIQEKSTGRCFVYGHLKGGTLKVTKGNNVHVGQEIATMGSSGDSGHMHLHFEIRKSKEVTLNTAVWGPGYHTFQIANSNTNLDPKDYIGSTPKIIKNITLTKPTKTQYIQGKETLNLSGAKIAVEYNSGIKTTINLPNNSVKVSGFNNSKIGKNTVTIQYENNKLTFDVEIIKEIEKNEPEEKKEPKKVVIPAKRTNITYMLSFKQRYINIYFDKPIMIEQPPVVNVTVENETKQAEFYNISNDSKRLIYRIKDDNFGMFSSGIMYISCDGQVIDKTEGNLYVECKFKDVAIGKLYSYKINHTFEKLITNNLGDLNRDGSVDGCDASMALALYAKLMSNEELTQLDKENLKIADVNLDGVVNGSDAGIILSYYAFQMCGYKPEDSAKIIKCDVDKDGLVNVNDFNELNEAINKGLTDKKYDLNNDEIIDSNDLKYIKEVLETLGQRSY